MSFLCGRSGRRRGRTEHGKRVWSEGRLERGRRDQDDTPTTHLPYHVRVLILFLYNQHASRQTTHLPLLGIDTHTFHHVTAYHALGNRHIDRQTVWDCWEAGWLAGNARRDWSTVRLDTNQKGHHRAKYSVRTTVLRDEKVYVHYCHLPFWSRCVRDPMR
jgi:hypothetical protein